MPIKAKYSHPAETKDVQFSSTVIRWDSQRILFQLTDGKNYSHKMTENDWNYLVTGLKKLMKKFPNISDVEIPEFNPNINEETL